MVPSLCRFCLMVPLWAVSLSLGVLGGVSMHGPGHFHGSGLSTKLAALTALLPHSCWPGCTVPGEQEHRDAWAAKFQ